MGREVQHKARAHERVNYCQDCYVINLCAP